MLARSFRLNKKNLTRVFQKGRRQRENYLLLRSMENRQGRPRFAVIISKKVAAKSSARNRLKRKTFEILGEHLEKLGNLDLAITFQKAPENEKEIETILRTALEKLEKK